MKRCKGTFGLVPPPSRSETQASDPAVLSNLLYSCPERDVGGTMTSPVRQDSCLWPHPHRGSLVPLPTPREPFPPRWSPGQGNGVGKRWHSSPVYTKGPIPRTGADRHREPGSRRKAASAGTVPSQPGSPFPGQPPVRHRLLSPTR